VACPSGPAAALSRSPTTRIFASGPRSNFLAQDVDHNRATEARVVPSQDPRLPMPGTLLVRRYHGKDVIVRVREDGFECDGRVHASLSAAVRVATGTRWNGFAFFGMGGKPGRKRGQYE
jgi:Protein of unknown function (DUF2924)